MATIELEVKKIYPDISKSEQRAADFFLNNKEAIFHYPLATLAKLSKTSQGAWVRFCKSLGYDGMKSLKNALFNEINNAKEEADENAIEFSDIHECSSSCDFVQSADGTSDVSKRLLIGWIPSAYKF